MTIRPLEPQDAAEAAVLTWNVAGRLSRLDEQAERVVFFVLSVMYVVRTLTAASRELREG